MTTQVKRLIVSALQSIEEEMTRAGETLPADKRPPSRRGKKTIVSHVDPNVAWQLKKLALDLDTTAQNLLDEAVADLFEKYHLPRIAQG